MFHSNQPTELMIRASIDEYKDLILQDINTKLRLITEDEKVHITDVHSWKNDTITFMAPLEKRDWVIFLVPTKIEACLITRKAIFMTTLEITARRIDSDVMYYQAKIESPLIKKQQRQHFRLEMLSPVQYSVVTQEDNNPNTLQKYKGTTVNLSIGGLCMVSDHAIGADQPLYIYLDFLDNSFIFLGKTLGSSSKNPNGTYSHRVQFDHLDNATSNLLSKLIFEKQRQMLRPSARPLYKPKA